MSYANRIIVAALLAALSVGLYMEAPALRTQDFSIYVSLVSLACLYMNIQYSVRRLWSSSSIFIVIFWCFHFGVILANAIGIDIINDAGNDVFWQWINSPLYTKAEALALAGIASFTLITVIKSDADVDIPEHDLIYAGGIEESPYYKALRILAYSLMTLGIGGWLYVMISMGGIAALFAGYNFYLRFIENYPIISLVYWSIGVGFALLGIVNKWKHIRVGVIVFGVWGIIAFIMGLRGEVLYPASGFLVTYSRQVKIPQNIKLFIMPVILLSLISFVKDYRIDSKITADSFNPVYGLIEMGSSLQTVVIAEEWIEQGLDHFRYGETIIAPVDRLVDRVTMVDRIDAESDMRLMNVAMGERNGPYGFSPIAEGFMNMGMLGVMLLMGLLSVLFNFFDSRPASIITDSYIGGITFILFTFIRNSFSHIPGQSLLLATIISIIYATFKRKE